MNKKINATNTDIGKRLDVVIAAHLPEHTRSRIKKCIDDGNVCVGSAVNISTTRPKGRGMLDIDPEQAELENPALKGGVWRRSRGIKKSSYKVKSGDVIEIEFQPPKELSARPENIPLDILYEDSDLVVVNKPAGMVVHPAAGNPDGTLVNALLYHCRDLSGIGGVLRPGIVHRLDKGTSGVIVAAKNDRAHNFLSEQFKKRETIKTYLALIYGMPRAKSGVFDEEIGRHPTDRKRMSTKTRHGRESITRWEVVENFAKHISLVKIRIVTGRTHQIRVHFSAHGLPLLGDAVYGGKKVIKRLPEGRYKEIVLRALRPMLHASSISFTHPTSREKVSIETVLPEDFRKILEELRAV